VEDQCVGALRNGSLWPTNCSSALFAVERRQRVARMQRSGFSRAELVIRGCRFTDRSTGMTSFAVESPLRFFRATRWL
ncbi:MAG: hypothetical protein AB7V26_14765, partial [Lysobacterales bacterium]